MLCNKRRLWNEKPAHCNETVAPMQAPQLKKSPRSKKDPPQPKTNKIIKILQAAQCSQKKKEEIWVSIWGRISQLAGKWREVWRILAIYKGPAGRLKIILCESRLVASNSLRPHRLDTVHGILQARIQEWVAFPFSRGSSQARDRTQVSCIGGGFFTSWATREAEESWESPESNSNSS